MKGSGLRADRKTEVGGVRILNASRCGQNREDTWLDRYLLPIYKKIEAGLGNGRGNIVQLVSPGRSDGSEVLARELAKVLAFKLDKRVLLIEAGRGPCSAHSYFGMETYPHPETSPRANEPPDSLWKRFEDTSLYLLDCAGCCRQTAGGVREPSLDGLLETLRGSFDVILIDSWLEPEQLQILPAANTADGCVMVIEAEKTRRETAARLKELILAQGGDILGVVLNKRRYVIPQTIYDLL